MVVIREGRGAHKSCDLRFVVPASFDFFSFLFFFFPFFFFFLFFTFILPPPSSSPFEFSTGVITTITTVIMECEGLHPGSFDGDISYLDFQPLWDGF